MAIGAAAGKTAADLHVELFAHVAGITPADAVAMLSYAREIGVDPLDFLSHRFGLGDALALQRGAGWARLPCAAAIPQTIRGSATHLRVNNLDTARALNATGAEGDVIYFAPGFDDLVTLSRRPERVAQLPYPIVLVTRRALREALADANAPTLLQEARQRLVRHWPRATASVDLGAPVRVGFVLALTAIVGFAAIAPMVARPLLLPFLLVMIIAPALLRLAATLHLPADHGAEPQLADGDVPRYSVLVPLRDEAVVVPQLAAALSDLDYPPEKLEVLFLVEAASPETADAVRHELGNPCFELIIIPDGPPHTKPKALDYALPLVRGEHVVVFDAEDIPARDQLRRAASRFAAHPELDCLQAELAIDNGRETWLTALFAGEYAGLFCLLLPFLAAQDLPLPLGGTSNHFRTPALRAVGGWDAFNVTEDADLGVRLARMGSRTGTLRSATAEEAPITLGGWMRQRTRWIKGWMQTFLVHNLHPGELLADIGWKGFVFFQVYVGSLIASSLIHTMFFCGLFAQVILAGPDFDWDVWDYSYLSVLVIGYGGAFSITLAGLLWRGQLALAPYQALLPVYWMLHAVAAVRAGVELLFRPHFWSKTQHGQTRLRRAAQR